MPLAQSVLTEQGVTQKPLVQVPLWHWLAPMQEAPSASFAAQLLLALQKKVLSKQSVSAPQLDLQEVVPHA
jgi:hypothetical protein